MFCGKCGKKLAEGWISCPYCGNEGYATIKNRLSGPEKSETIDVMDDDAELKKEWAAIKNFFREHPLRAVLCVLILVYMAYLICTVFTYNFHNALHGQGMMRAVADLLPVFVKITFCENGLWLIYGPRNYKHIKELLTDKPQKGCGIVSHIAAFVVAVALLLIYAAI